MTFSWTYEPIFCFTSDVDWASEQVLSESHSVSSGKSLGLATSTPTLALIWTVLPRLVKYGS